jgi:ubiquitin carboxyl-terminal hydrolase 7
VFPLFLLHTNVKQGEIFKETKERLSKRTGIKGKPFEKIKFAVVPRASFSSPRYIEDGKFTRLPCCQSLYAYYISDDILSDIAGPDDYLGLDHASKSRGFWGKSDSFFIR